MKNSMTWQSERGFTLVEIIVVIVIIGILMTTFGGKVFGSADRTKAEMARIKMTDVKSKIDEFKFRYNKIPNSFDDLTSCTDLTGSGCTPIVSSKDELEDTWGTPLRYEKSGDRAFKITSLGADGKTGGSGVDADIVVEGP